MVNQGGLVVKTTLDLDKQKIAEEVIEEQAEANLGYNATNAALLSMDPKNGEILAMVGSVDYFNEEIDGQVNVTTRPRQPGSSFKPIVYTLGWQRGYAPATIVFDVVTSFPGGGKAYEPKNYDLSERGPVSLRKALQGSLNIPAVKMLYLVGVENLLDFAEDLGYSTFADRSRFGLSLVLGGGEVTLLEHTAAYATLANSGEYHKPISLLEVATNNGDVLDTFESDGRQVMDENIAHITTNVLSDNGARAYVFGASSPLQLGGRPAAAKTGTTNDYRDAWTMGYTPSLATGVWAGNNDFSEMNRGAGGSILAAPIWQKYMLRALEDTEVESFPSATLPSPSKSILSGKGFGTKLVTIDRASGKLATSYTPASYREDKLYVEAHSILHYIDRNDPNGEGGGGTDPQYEKWEEAVQAWIQARIEANEPIFDEEHQPEAPGDLEIVYGLPPEEEDDLHVPENQPSLTIVSPASGTELETRSINIDVSASAPRGISRVEYYLDGILIGTSASAPYGLNASLKSFPNGFYTLQAIAYDDIDNSQQESAQIEIQSEESYARVDLVNPVHGAEYEYDAVNIPIQLDIDSPDPINQVTFFDQYGNTNDVIEALINPSNGLLEVLWTPSEPGNHTLYARVSVEGAGVFTSPSTTVVVKDPPEPEDEEAESSE
jgi:membrane carboxypeptidase/penicillin-binding protein PbpC